MQRIYITLLILMLAALACNLPMTNAPTAVPPTAWFGGPDPTNTPMATEAPGDATAAPTPVAPGIGVTVGNVSFVIPKGLANSETHETVARAEGDNVAPWEIAPEHTKFILQNYVLQGTFHQPQIFVYPAQDYATMFEGAAESLKRLQAIIATPDAPIDAKNLPFIPFFNAGSQFASKIQIIRFQNGSGVRFLTQYGQDVGPITNEGLFYQFQGLTTDGKYYVIAILPINHPSLPAKYDAPVPSGGIPFPDINAANPDFPGYYNQVADMLNTAPAEAFTPKLSQLDALVQSIAIAP